MTTSPDEIEVPTIAIWPDGPGEPLKPEILTGAKAVLFYILNLIILLVVAAPFLALEPPALQGLDCFLSRHPDLLPLQIFLGLAVMLTLFAAIASVIWSANLWLFRRWIARFGLDEFRAYLYHDRLQRMGVVGRKLNALALRRTLR